MAEEQQRYRGQPTRGTVQGAARRTARQPQRGVQGGAQGQPQQRRAQEGAYYQGRAQQTQQRRVQGQGSVPQTERRQAEQTGRQQQQTQSHWLKVPFYHVYRTFSKSAFLDVKVSPSFRPKEKWYSNPVVLLSIKRMGEGDGSPENRVVVKMNMEECIYAANLLRSLLSVKSRPSQQQSQQQGKDEVSRDVLYHTSVGGNVATTMKFTKNLSRPGVMIVITKSFKDAKKSERYVMPLTDPQAVTLATVLQEAPLAMAIRKPYDLFAPSPERKLREEQTAAEGVAEDVDYGVEYEDAAELDEVLNEGNLDEVASAIFGEASEFGGEFGGEFGAEGQAGEAEEFFEEEVPEGEVPEGEVALEEAGGVGVEAPEGGLPEEELDFVNPEDVSIGGEDGGSPPAPPGPQYPQQSAQQSRNSRSIRK